MKKELVKPNKIVQVNGRKKDEKMMLYMIKEKDDVTCKVTQHYLLK